jgi:hypothetical protein
VSARIALRKLLMPAGNFFWPLFFPKMLAKMLAGQSIKIFDCPANPYYSYFGGGGGGGGGCHTPHTPQRCQVRDFIPRSRDFLKQLGFFLDFIFKSQSRDFFGIF